MGWDGILRDGRRDFSSRVLCCARNIIRVCTAGLPRLSRPERGACMDSTARIRVHTSEARARPDRSLCRPHTTASIASSPGPDDTRTSPWSSHQATTSRLMPYLHLALVTTGRTRQGGIHGARMTMCLHGRIGGKMSSFAPPRPALPPLFPGRAAWPTCEERRGGREADPICRAVSALSDLWAGAGRIAEAGVVRGWVTW